MRRRFIELQRELAQLSVYAPAAVAPMMPVQHYQKYSYSLIENAIAKFTGDDTYGVNKWLSDFDVVMAPLCCDAELWMQSTHANSWPDFRRKFKLQFHRVFSINDMLYEMSKIEYDPKLGLNNYIIRMKAVAARGPDLGEVELIRQITNGLKDRNAFMLYSAKNLDDLRDMAHDYDRVRREASANSKTSQQAKSTTNQSKLTTSTPSGPRKNTTDCFNCGKTGHFSRNCPGPRRET